MSRLTRGAWLPASVRRRLSGRPTPTCPSVEALFSRALRALLDSRNSLVLAQVGANDGKTGDPIYEVLRHELARTHLLLIEPQAEVIEELRRSYADHPRATIAQCAVGPPGTLRLYQVRPECWHDCEVPYATGWPSYRAPSGITSASRRHVDVWVRQHYRGPLPSSDVVRVTEVPSMPLREVMRQSGFVETLDALVVDVEGFDDTVLMHCDVQGLRPAAIPYEHKHLRHDRRIRLRRRLRTLGYRLDHDLHNSCTLLAPLHQELAS